MTRRLLVLAAAAAALSVAAPAQAAVYPVCQTNLVNAAAGVTKSCPTDGVPAMAGATTVRVVTVEVAAGVAEATVTCGYGWEQRSRSIVVSGPQPRTFSMYESSDGSCRTSLTALYANTTAVAVSTFSYVFVGPA